VKAEWKLIELGQLATVGAGNSAPQEKTLFFGGTTPFFRTSDIGRVRFGDIETSTDLLNESGTRGLRLFPAGTILFPKSGASTFLNHRVMMQVDGCVSSHLATITTNHDVAEPRFLLYFLATIQAQDMVQDHAYPSLNLPLISGIKVPTPTIEEQRRIVTLLDEAFADIATAKANAEKNLQNARELFEEQLTSIFGTSHEDWIDATIDQHIRFIDYRGKTPVKTSEGLRLITAKNVKMGFLQTQPEEFVASETYDSWMTRGIPKQGDVLFTTEAPLANVAQLDTDEKVVFAQRIIIMQSDQQKLNPTFLKYLLLSPPIQQRIKDQGTGATVQGIKASLLKKIRISFPSNLHTQDRLVAMLDDFTAEIDRLDSIYRQKLTALDDLKKSLLHQAFRGQL
jgi:type I restriction enzyme S subunit